MDTTTHIDFCDISFMSLKVIFSSSFIICDICVTKINSLPILCHKRSYATKTYFFVINLMTIILSSLICDTHFFVITNTKKRHKTICLNYCICAT